MCIRDSRCRAGETRQLFIGGCTRPTKLLPHVGSASVETRQQMADLVLDNLRAFIASGKLLTPL